METWQTSGASDVAVLHPQNQLHMSVCWMQTFICCSLLSHVFLVNEKSGSWDYRCGLVAEYCSAFMRAQVHPPARVPQSETQDPGVLYSNPLRHLTAGLSYRTSSEAGAPGCLLSM